MLRSTLKEQIRAEMQIGSMQELLLNQWINDGLDWMSDELRHIRNSDTILTVVDTASYDLAADFLERFVGTLGSKPITIADYKSFREAIPRDIQQHNYAYIEPSSTADRFQLTLGVVPDTAGDEIAYDYIGKADHPTLDWDIVETGGFEYDRLLKAYLREQVALYVVKDPNLIQLYRQEREMCFSSLQGKRDRKTGASTGVSFHWS